MKTLKLITLLIIYNLTFNISHAQTPVDSVGSGCALDFDGVSNRVVVPDNPILSGMNEITISAWVNLYSYTSATAKSPIVNKWESTFSSGNKDTYSFFISSSTGQVAFAFHTTGGVPPDPWGTIYHYVWNTNYFCPTNQWMHLSLTRVGTILKLYVNGILQDSSNGVISANPFVVSTKEVQIGGEIPALNLRFLQGQIDEVRIWNYARTQTEIQRDMCRKLTGNEPGLVGYWRFDDCGGLTATDASGNGNNGTLY